MISKIVKYKCKTDKLSTVLEIIDEFIHEIKTHDTETKYSVYRVGEFEFYHIMSFASVDAELKHRAAPYTKEFVSKLYPACTKEINSIDMTLYATTRISKE